MRNLTIQRHKAFPGSLMRISFYMEDPAGDVQIGDVTCSLLGKLKNGESKTFSVPETDLRIYAVGSKMERNFINECYQLEAGTEDAIISGKCHLNPGVGNPFQFDGITDKETLAKRKKNAKRGPVILIFSILLGLVLGVIASRSILSERPKTFVAKELTITLTNQFSPAKFDGLYVGFDSPDAAVLVVKEPFSLAEGFGDLSVDEYMALAATGAEANIIQQPKTENGISWFEYTNRSPVDNYTYFYFAAAYKTDDAFWLIQFTTTVENKEAYIPHFTQWAQSVHFS